MVRILSWNINGIRAAHRNGIVPFLKKECFDIVLFQEVKAGKMQIPEEFHHMGYHIDVCEAGKKGYSGVMAMTSQKPVSISHGIGFSEADGEGRSQIIEFGSYFLVNAYFPNSQRGLLRLDYKIEFDEKFLDFCNGLRKKKPLVICGDFNVAHQEIDIARPRDNRNNAGFTDRERNWMTRFLNAGYVDTFRLFTKEGGHYTWWSYRFDARSRNIGWRIDYFIVSDDIRTRVENSWIVDYANISDHAPVALDLHI